MSHKLLTEDIVERKQSKRLKLPPLGGKFGVSLYIGQKEVFVGVSVSEVEIEQVVRKKMVKTRKGKVQVLQFD